MCTADTPALTYLALTLRRRFVQGCFAEYRVAARAATLIAEDGVTEHLVRRGKDLGKVQKTKPS